MIIQLFHWYSTTLQNHQMYQKILQKKVYYLEHNKVYGKIFSNDCKIWLKDKNFEKSSIFNFTILFLIREKPKKQKSERNLELCAYTYFA